MIHLIFAAALLGATITFVALWRYGMVVAIIGSPFGASLFALIVSLIMLIRRKYQGTKVTDLNPLPYENRKVARLIDRNKSL